MTILVYTGNAGKLNEFKNFFSSSEQQILGLSDLKNITQLNISEANEDSDYFLTNAFIKVFTALKFIYENKHINAIKTIKSLLIDDSGLCVPDLGFLPGVHSAVYAGAPKSDTKNREKLSKEINSIFLNDGSKDSRLKGFFVCFLFEFKISDIEKLSFVKNYNFSSASSFVNSLTLEVEKELLKKVNLDEIGGAKQISMTLNDFFDKFPKDLFLNIYYGFCCGEVSAVEQNLISGVGHGYDSQFFSNANKNLSFASISMQDKNKISHRAFAMEALKNGHGKKQ